MMNAPGFVLLIKIELFVRIADDSATTFKSFGTIIPTGNNYSRQFSPKDIVFLSRLHRHSWSSFTPPFFFWMRWHWANLRAEGSLEKSFERAGFQLKTSQSLTDNPWLPPAAISDIGSRKLISEKQKNTVFRSSVLGRKVGEPGLCLEVALWATSAESWKCILHSAPPPAFAENAILAATEIALLLLAGLSYRGVDFATMLIINCEYALLVS